MRQLFILLFFGFSIGIFAQENTKNNLKIDVSGYLDTYYSYDFDASVNKDKQTFLYNYNKQNSFNINIALVRASISYENVYAKVSVQSGTYVEANYATNYNFETDRYEFKQKGKGFGFDFGISFIDRFQEKENYNLKMSLNILDVGRINFTGEKHLFQGQNLTIINNPNLDDVKFESPNQYLQLLSEEVYGNKNASLQGTDFQTRLSYKIFFSLKKSIN